MKKIVLTALVAGLLFASENNTYAQTTASIAKVAKPKNQLK